MYERSTNSNEPEKAQAIHTTTETSDPQRMGIDRQRCDGRPKASDSPSHPLPLAQGLGARCRDLFEWQTASDRSKDKATGGGKPKTQRGIDDSDPRADVIKKKDELGLTNRCMGTTYSNIQRMRIIAEVERFKAVGITKFDSLKALGVCRSTYYGWLQPQKVRFRKSSIMRLTDIERKAVIQQKKKQPQLSHRKISGYIRSDGFWVSPSSCYRILKALGWIESQKLRKAPWRVAHYEPYRPNQIWGEDWTIITISGQRYYLLTIIDYFSRYIVAWGIVKSVTQVEVRNLIALAHLSEKIDGKRNKPIIRFDRGSPNMAYSTQRLIKNLEMILSPGRAYRPTDNARQERWYRTVKQEEIYCYPTYPTDEIARYSLSKYIHEYNEERPHQAIWNFTPGFVHRHGNKSLIYAHYKEKVKFAKEQRIAFNRSRMRHYQSVSN
jgi:putative transposase